MRVRLAALMAFVMEIGLGLAWTPRPPVELALLPLAYLVLAAFTLDVGVRLRVRGVYGVLALAGLAALVHAIIAAPVTGFADLPRTVFTRVLGAGGLAAGIALYLLIVLHHPARGRSWLPFVLLAGLGVAWGVWGRWSVGLYTGDPTAQTDPAVLFGSAGLALVGLLVLMGVRLPVGGDLRLGRLGWTLTGGVLAGLVAVRLAGAQLDGLALAFSVPLLAACAGVLYWQYRPAALMVWDGLTPPVLGWQTTLLIGLLIGGALIGYALPRGAGAADPAFVLSAVFTAYGFVWLPALAALIALRGLGRRLRAGQL